MANPTQARVTIQGWLQWSYDRHINGPAGGPLPFGTQGKFSIIVRQCLGHGVFHNYTVVLPTGTAKRVSTWKYMDIVEVEGFITKIDAFKRRNGDLDAVITVAADKIKSLSSGPGAIRQRLQDVEKKTREVAKTSPPPLKQQDEYDEGFIF